MIETIDNLVTFEEPDALRVADTLIEKGYVIASQYGNRVSEPSHDAIGILKPQKSLDETVVKTGLFGRKREVKIKHEKIASFPGTLYFSNERLGAGDEIKWVLNVYGRENKDEMVKLAKELTKLYKVPITVKIETLYPKSEDDPNSHRMD